MEDNTPRVLVISHTVFSATGNMGKTMMRMLAGIPPDAMLFWQDNADEKYLFST